MSTFLRFVSKRKYFNFSHKRFFLLFFLIYSYNIISILNYPGPASPISRVPVWPQEGAHSQTTSICGHKGTRTKGDDGFKCEKLNSTAESNTDHHITAIASGYFLRLDFDSPNKLLVIFIVLKNQ